MVLIKQSKEGWGGEKESMDVGKTHRIREIKQRLTKKEEGTAFGSRGMQVAGGTSSQKKKKKEREEIKNHHDHGQKDSTVLDPNGEAQGVSHLTSWSRLLKKPGGGTSAKKKFIRGIGGKRREDMVARSGLRK